jgi:MFS transporter, AAHS family, 4-hydroxybenzoate transporter
VKHTAVNVGDLLDRGEWGAYQRWLVALTALAIVFDGVDNQLMGVAIPAIMREWSIPRAAFASVISFSYLGMMAGSALAGLAGDRFGRRAALLGSVVIFGATTTLAAAADDVSTLAALRFLTGIGLGGAIPNGAALAAEFVPIRKRPIAVTVTIVCVPFGAMLAGLLAIPALSTIGWRGMFVIGGVVPLAAAVALRAVLPESPRYLARRPARRLELVAMLRRIGHSVPDDASFVDPSDASVAHASLATLFAPRFRFDTIALWISFFSCLLAVYLAFSWIPSLLASGGFGPSVASTGITAFNLGGVAGALAGGLVIGRWGSRRAMLAMAALAAASAAAMAGMPLSPRASVFPLMVMLTGLGALINGVQTTMYALATHVYPAAVRATGVGWAVAFGRSGAVLSGYAGAWALEYSGAASFYGLIAGAMAVCCVALASVRHHVPGR